MKWFDGVHSLDRAKERYHELLKQHHPDHGGSDESCREIIEEFEQFCKLYMQGKFDRYTADTKKQTFGANSTVFGSILAEICKLNVTVEIIGYWIYVTNCFDVKDTLKAMGLWWCVKHKAWVYNGSFRRKIHSKNTLQDIRAKYGNVKIKEKEDQEQIAQ